MATPLSEAVIEDIERISRRRVLHSLDDWQPEPETTPDPASAIIETPVYRQDAGLWEHQKYFVKTAFDAHRGPYGKARFVLADQVGLGKTLQLAMAAQLIALTGDKPILVICPKTLVMQWQRLKYSRRQKYWRGQKYWLRRKYWRGQAKKGEKRNKKTMRNNSGSIGGRMKDEG